MPEFHYRWQWHLQSTCEALWPFVADKNRFNRDTGIPEIERRDDPKTGRSNGRRLLRLERLGIAVEEESFEWTRPSKFGVTRHYRSGPVATMRVLVELTPAPGGGASGTGCARWHCPAPNRFSPPTPAPMTRRSALTVTAGRPTNSSCP